MSSTSASPSLRVLVVDDHGIVREGIASLLRGEENLTVVGFAASGEAAIRLALRLAPDVVIMDLALPDLNGVDATQRILHLLPGTAVIALSASHSAEHVYRALRAGARGYLTKEVLGRELIAAIGAVLRGETYLGGEIAQVAEIVTDASGRSGSPIERLSDREREVLQRTAAGTSTAQIARELSLSPKTVDTYRSRLMHKLGVRNRTELIRFAIAHALAPG